MNVAVGAPNPWRGTAIWALRVVLGLLFVMVGIAKLTGIANTVEYFAAIWTWCGAIMLACSVGTAAVISLTVFRGNVDWGGVETIVVPLALTVLALYSRGSHVHSG